MSTEIDQEMDEMIFADEDAESSESPSPAIEAKTWKIIVSDDEKEVHNITLGILKGFTFDGGGLTFLHAYSGEETKRIVAENPDTALILLDVVMEEEDSGLDVARYIREDLGNHDIRIVLRTGQPGSAPERRVVAEFDINDYKEKTELTSRKLFTTITSALRGFRDIRTIERSRKGLEKIINASATLFEPGSLKQFTSGVLTQMLSILRFDESSLYIGASGFAASSGKRDAQERFHQPEDYKVLAGAGDYKDAIDKAVPEIVSEDVWRQIEEAVKNKERSLISKNGLFTGFFQTNDGSQNILFAQGRADLDDLDRELLQVFSGNLAIAFDNVYLNQDIMNTQKEVIFTLGEVAESRSKETGHHVKRVAEYSRLLGLKSGLSEEDAEILWQASPMHDVGKLAIPDAILNKPGRLTDEEFDLMKTHSEIGYNFFKESSRTIMKKAGIIALQHHEKWDGTGYPHHLKGEEIDIYGRIVVLADVFDALSHKRCYKEAWAMDRIRALIQEEREKHFDPRLVDVFLKDFSEFEAIFTLYP